jgi:hypothetical protein
MRIDGKPLIMIHNSAAAPQEVWRQMFANLEAADAFGAYFAASYNPSDLELFVGLHQYAIIGSRIWHKSMEIWRGLSGFHLRWRIPRITP